MQINIVGAVIVGLVIIHAFLMEQLNWRITSPTMRLSAFCKSSIILVQKRTFVGNITKPWLKFGIVLQCSESCKHI
jgi:hypothetical protein